MKLRIAELRKSANIRQQELAKMVFLSQGALSNIEHNIKMPGLETAKRIADALNVKIDDLIKE